MDLQDYDDYAAVADAASFGLLFFLFGRFACRLFLLVFFD
jgi:hypothetical protein